MIQVGWSVIGTRLPSQDCWLYVDFKMHMLFPYDKNEIIVYSRQLVHSQIQNPLENCVATDGYQVPSLSF